MNKIMLLFGLVIYSSYIKGQDKYDVGETEVEVTLLQENIALPWEIIWGDNHIWMTHDNGKVSHVDPITGQIHTVLNIPDMYTSSNLVSNRMLGLALSVGFPTTPFVYVNYVYKGNIYEEKWDRYEKIVRYRYEKGSDKLIEPLILLDGIKVYDGWRIGGKLLMAPDGQHLFLSIGDAKQPTNPEIHPEWVESKTKPQSLNSFSGKVIRINIEGTVPSDNPFRVSNDRNIPRNLIWSLGHRNTQGLAFGPNGQLYYSEHGENSDDEFGIIERGGNHGWPIVQGFCDNRPRIEGAPCGTETNVEPLHSWQTSIAPSNIEFYNNSAIATWQNSVLLTTLTGYTGGEGNERTGEDIRAMSLTINGNGLTSNFQETQYFDQKYLRIRDLCVAPNGDVYFTTSNLVLNQGRFLGNDDKIYRIRAINQGSDNNIPTDISLTSDMITEGLSIGTEVGRFSTSDSDVNNTHTYILVDGAGSNDNDSFSISGDRLLTGKVFDASSKKTYSIRVRTTDNGGLFFEKIFSIAVLEKNSTETYFRIEAEDGYSLESEAGGNGIINVQNGVGLSNGIGVVLPDEGDKISIKFTLSERGRYIIRVGSRSGSSTSEQDKTDLWFDSNFQPIPNYIFTLDGIEKNIYGDKSCPDIFSSNVLGGSWWGPMINTFADISAGQHTITIEAKGAYLGVDYIELEKVPERVGVLEIEDRFTVISDQGDKGRPRALIEETVKDCFGGQAVILWDIEDAISVSFEVLEEGEIEMALRVRTGDAAGISRHADKYRLTLDGNSLTLPLDASTVEEELTWGKSGWGELKGRVLLTAGTHRLDIRSGVTFLGVDWLYIGPTTVFNNHPPTDIVLSNTSVEENRPANTLIGQLSSIDSDEGDMHNYALVGGYPDNTFFEIDGNRFVTKETFDFENRSVFIVRVRTTDQEGASFEKDFTIRIENVVENSNPTDISLTKNFIEEGLAARTTIGSFSTSDPDTEDFHFYTKVSGVGDDDNASFHLEGPILYTDAVFDYEAKNTYSIRIQTDDRNGGTLQKVFKINILDVEEDNGNNMPTDIELSNNSIQENLPKGSVIGDFSTVDPTPNEQHVYTLSAGEGDDNNDNFSISENQLLANISFDFEVKSSYSIRIRSTNTKGLLFEKIFIVKIEDLIENSAPTNILLDNNSINEGLEIGSLVGKLTTEDANHNDTHKYTLVNGFGDTDNQSFLISENQILSNEVFDCNEKSTYSIRIQSEDNSSAFVQIVFLILINGCTIDNNPPTEVVLDNESIKEGLPTGSEIGILSTIDSDEQDSHIYSLIDGIGDDNNVSFIIQDNKLLSNEVFDFEKKSIYTIRIQTDDGKGGIYQKVFLINIINVDEGDNNNAPIDIILDNNSIDENQPIGTLIGTFSTNDPDQEDTHTYTLVAGNGDEDNIDFIVVPSKKTLESRKVYDFNVKKKYSIRVKTNDGKGGSFEKVFEIKINNINIAPELTRQLGNQEFTANDSINFSIGEDAFFDSDGDMLTFSARLEKENELPEWLSFKQENLTFAGFPTNKNVGSYQIYIKASDGIGGELETSFKITINEPLSLANKLHNHSVTIYPNPAEKILIVKVNNFYLGKVQISIYSLEGKEIISNSFNKETYTLEKSIGLEGLRNGIYLIQIKTEEVYIIKKIIKK